MSNSTLTTEAAKAAKSELLLELSQAQRDLLQSIEAKLTEKLGLQREHLFGTGECSVDPALQQGVIYLAKKHPKLALKNDWLAEYFELPSWKIDYFNQHLEHFVKSSGQAKLSQAILGTWRETNPDLVASA